MQMNKNDVDFSGHHLHPRVTQKLLKSETQRGVGQSENAFRDLKSKEMALQTRVK